MRLIVKEYISQLKEKDELDLLLSEIFVQKGYVADNQPKTGNRQYGVDIQMHNASELLLLVVKQGDIDRRIWDGNMNSVRPSLDEIKDVIINNLAYSEKKKKIKIIVATNGYLDESINLNWKNYINNNQVWNNVTIEISFMGIDEIVKAVQECFFNEYLFDKGLHSAMRKALYFIDEGDYRREYYEVIINDIIKRIEEAGSNKKKFNKACSTLYLSSQMICQYANENGNAKIGIMVSEYTIIQYWKYLLKNNLLEKEKYIGWLIKFCQCLERWNDLYCAKISQVANKEVILPNYNVVENRVLLYEILEHLATYALYLWGISNINKSQYVLNIIINVINNYPFFTYAPYDSSVRVMIMIYKLLFFNDRIEELKELIKQQTYTLMNYYRISKKYPAPTDTFQEAIDIEYGNNTMVYRCSAFWGYYLLLLAVFDCEEQYDTLKEFLRKDIEKVSKCVWFLRKDEELLFYDPIAMNLSGEGVEVPVEDDYSIFQNKASFILEQYKKEVLSFDEYCFPGLEMVICHYYGYIPRIKFENLEEMP